MIRYLWSFGNTRIVFKEKSQMKSGGGLLFTAWLLLMAWCLFSNRVSTATVVGNGYLQVFTCKYLIFCSLNKYKLFKSVRLRKNDQSNWSQLWWGAPEAWLTLGHAPLNSHRCCPMAVPSLVEQLPCISIQTARIGLKFGGRTPDGTARACPGGPASPDQSVHPCSYPFRQKRGFFSMGNANSRNQEKGVVFIFNFGKLNSHSLITQSDDMTCIHK